MLNKKNESMNFNEMLKSNENNIRSDKFNNYCTSFNNSAMSLNSTKQNNISLLNNNNNNINVKVEPKAGEELEIYVENMLNELKTKMQSLSDNLLNKVDNMEKYLDELENTMMNYTTQNNLQ